MSSRARQAEDKEALRTRILDAARALFASQGYAATSMRKIAAAIGYSPTTLYLYFRNKEDLLIKLCEQDFLGLRKGFEQAATLPDPVERLAALGRGYVEFAARYPNHFQFMFMSPMPWPQDMVERSAVEQGNPQQDAYALLQDTVRACVEAGRCRPQYDDVEQITQLMWASVHGLAALHHTHGADPWITWRPLDSSLERQLELVLRGLLTPAAFHKWQQQGAR